MSSNKGRSRNLNHPLQRLLERLHALQVEAGDALEAAHRDVPSEDDSGGIGSNSAARSDIAASVETQVSKAAIALLERWDIPTRGDLDDIRERLAKLERAVASLAHTIEPGEKVRKITKSQKRQVKRRSSGPTRKTPAKKP